MHPPLKSKFKPLSVFEEPLSNGYALLPFRFFRLESDRYFLSNLVGEYLIVDRDTLNELVKHRLTPDKKDYNDLKSKHFLYDSDSKVSLDLLSLKYRTKMMPLANFTSLHMFVVTLRCEHSCPYCQVSRQSQDKEKFDMSQEVALKGIEFTFNSPAPAIKIEFQGGESLLNFDLIKFIVKEAKERNKISKRDLQFVIATNLAVLTDEILYFCLKENVYLSTSLDGPEDLHNQNRPRPGGNSYQKAIEGINRTRQLLGPDHISALMTTTEASLKRGKDIIDEYIRQGFNNIFLRSISPYGFAVKTKKYSSYGMSEWLPFWKEGLDYIIDINKNGHFFAENYSSIILNKMLTPFGSNYVDLQSPAGIGISAILFNYDGDVYASDEGRMLAEMGNKKFRLGSLLTDTYHSVMTSENLLEPLETSLGESAPMCTDCAFLPYCGSEPVFHLATQNDYLGHKAFSAFCHKNMSVVQHLIGLLESSRETRDVLMSWVRV